MRWSFSYFWSAEAEGWRLRPRVESISAPLPFQIKRGLYLLFFSDQITARPVWDISSSSPRFFLYIPYPVATQFGSNCLLWEIFFTSFSKKTQQEENTSHTVKSLFFANDLWDGWLWKIHFSSLSAPQLTQGLNSSFRSESGNLPVFQTI